MVKNDFSLIQILDKFYQTSSHFPMPVVLKSTIAPSGKTNLGLSQFSAKCMDLQAHRAMASKMKTL